MAEEETVKVTEEIVEEVVETPEGNVEAVVEKTEEVVEETPEEKVAEKQEEVVVEEAVEVPPEAPKENVLSEAHQVLREWKNVYEVEQPKAEDVFYCARELYAEDKDLWDHGRHKVKNGEWTDEQFDDEVQTLKKKQDPAWDKLFKVLDSINSKLEQPAENVKASADAVKASIGPHPINKYLGKAKPTEQEAEVRHEYHWKLQQEFKDAKAQYQEICGYPEGLLSRVKLFRVNVVREDINITEDLHAEKKNKFQFKNLPLLGKSGA